MQDFLNQALLESTKKLEGSMFNRYNRSYNKVFYRGTKRDPAFYYLDTFTSPFYIEHDSYFFGNKDRFEGQHFVKSFSGIKEYRLQPALCALACQELYEDYKAIKSKSNAQSQAQCIINLIFSSLLILCLVYKLIKKKDERDILWRNYQLFWITRLNSDPGGPHAPHFLCCNISLEILNIKKIKVGFVLKEQRA